MKRFALAIALACVLSGSALAGDVHTTGAPEPAPTTQSSSVAATVILTILSLIR
jgi:opacity protein-like surface antigen